MNKDYIILGLLSAFIVSIVFAGYLYFSPRTINSVKTETKVVHHNDYSVSEVKDWMLRVGVSNAWVENTPQGKSDCFVTTMVNRAAFAYCELR